MKFSDVQNDRSTNFRVPEKLEAHGDNPVEGVSQVEATAETYDVHASQEVADATQAKNSGGGIMPWLKAGAAGVAALVGLSLLPTAALGAGPGDCQSTIPARVGMYGAQRASNGNPWFTLLGSVVADGAYKSACGDHANRAGTAESGSVADKASLQQAYNEPFTKNEGMLSQDQMGALAHLAGTLKANPDLKARITTGKMAGETSATLASSRKTSVQIFMGSKRIPGSQLELTKSSGTVAGGMKVELSGSMSAAQTSNSGTTESTQQGSKPGFYGNTAGNKSRMKIPIVIGPGGKIDVPWKRPGKVERPEDGRVFDQQGGNATVNDGRYRDNPNKEGQRTTW